MNFYIAKFKDNSGQQLIKCSIYNEKDDAEENGMWNRARILHPQIAEVEAVYHTTDQTEEDIWCCADFDAMFEVLTEQLK